MFRNRKSAFSKKTKASGREKGELDASEGSASAASGSSSGSPLKTPRDSEKAAVNSQASKTDAARRSVLIHIDETLARAQEKDDDIERRLALDEAASGDTDLQKRLHEAINRLYEIKSQITQGELSPAMAIDDVLEISSTI